MLPIPGRLLKKVVHKHIIDHMQTNDLFTKAQYGFRPGLGTTDAIFDFVNYLFSETDQNKSLSICYVDGSKAFDSVCHFLLLKKCEALKIDKFTLKWLKSYLGNRRQTTLLNNTRSDECKVNYGVPQGSSLGPLLFLIFVNDFPNIIQESKTFMYADDIVIVSSANTHEESGRILQRELVRTHQWCSENCITINAKKTKVMRICRNNNVNVPPLNVKVGDCELEEIKEYTYLGAIIDWKLTTCQ